MSTLEIVAFLISFVGFILTVGGVGIVFGKTMAAVNALHERLDVICSDNLVTAAEERVTKKENGIYRNGEPDRVRRYRNNESPLRACEDRFTLIQTSLTNLEKQMAVIMERIPERERDKNE
jgi:hypothetical protein